MKRWKEDLGEANRKHLHLERKFENLMATEKNLDQNKCCLPPNTSLKIPVATDVPVNKLKKTNVESFTNSVVLASDVDTEKIGSICAPHIPHYTPNYFMGEKINSA